MSKGIEETAVASSGGGQAVPAYLDPSLPRAERLADLMSRMTFDEKLAQLGAIWSFEVLDAGAVDPRRSAERLGHGIGQVTRPSGATNFPPRDVAAMVDAIQEHLVDRTRLAIPAIVHEETLHGVMARDATCYPQAIGQAATWDPALIERMAALIGRHLRSIGVSQALAPVLDVARDPRWGRIEETFGEDAYLVASMGCATIRGIQASAPGERGVLATAKHMVGHGVPEGGLNQAPVHIGHRELHDTYLFPFEAAVRDAAVGSVMHAYDDLDGLPCVASHELLTAVLRERWGFKGIVVADYLGIEHLVTLHQLVDDLSDAASLALRAGLDMELPATAAFGEPLRRAVEDGRVDIGLVDRAVERVLDLKLRLGLFERSRVDPAAVPATRTDEAEVATEIARRSIVLLENDGILPLSDESASIAVIGPIADSPRELIGDYAHLVHIETLLENRGREGVAGREVPLDLQLADELASWPTILQAIRERAPDVDIRHARGSGILEGSEAELQAAVEAARGADVAILVVGERSGLTAAATSGETRDRLELGLPGRQAELVSAVAATGVPVVIVLVAGRPLAIPAEARLAGAVLHAWVPGEGGPAAIAEVLFGDVSPGGKLPVTVPRHVGQVPIYYGHKPSGGRSQWHEEYVDGSHLPLWPFGHGRSYSRFALEDFRLSDASLPADGRISVALAIANIGDRTADEVVQLYVRDLAASVTRPLKELRGFARVRLAPGERRHLVFTLSAEQLAFTGVDGRLVIEPGRHRVMIGTSSVDLPWTGEFEVVGEARTLAARSHFFSQVDLSPARPSPSAADIPA